MNALPDLGNRLAEFMVKRALNWTHDNLAREFNLTPVEVMRLLERHGDPPKLIGQRLPARTRPGFIERSQPVERDG